MIILQPLYIHIEEVQISTNQQNMFHIFICLSELHVTVNWKLFWGVNVALWIIILLLITIIMTTLPNCKRQFLWYFSQNEIYFYTDMWTSLKCRWEKGFFLSLKQVVQNIQSFNFFFTRVESGHHLKRGIANIKGQELLTGVISGMEKLLYKKSLWRLKAALSKQLGHNCISNICH